jgi:hypothetical protein
MFWTSECFARKAEGNALGFEADDITFEEVSLVY